MLKSVRVLYVTAALCAAVLTQSVTALAAGSAQLQGEVASRIAAAEQLKNADIKVHVEGRLVVLHGEVRLYEQKLVSERIAWTTPGVYEVDNELRVIPKVPYSDTDIARKIREIVYAHERFRAAGVNANVDQGRVRLQGSFLGYSDPTDLKHRVAVIEGVVEIQISARFIASPGAKRIPDYPGR